MLLIVYYFSKHIPHLNTPHYISFNVKLLIKSSHLTLVRSLQIQCWYIQRNPAMNCQALIQKAETPGCSRYPTLPLDKNADIYIPLRYIQILYIQ